MKVKQREQNRRTGQDWIAISGEVWLFLYYYISVCVRVNFWEISQKCTLVYTNKYTDLRQHLTGFLCSATLVMLKSNQLRHDVSALHSLSPVRSSPRSFPSARLQRECPTSETKTQTETDACHINGFSSYITQESAHKESFQLKASEFQPNCRWKKHIGTLPLHRELHPENFSIY